MTWKPCPRDGVEHLTLPLDPRQGFLLSRLDGTLDVPTLAALMNLGEEQVSAMLDELVLLGAVDPAVPGFQQLPAAPPLAQAEPESAPEGEGRTGEEDSAIRDKAATHRQLFEQHLRARPQDQRLAHARVAAEPDLTAFCFDPATEVIRAVLENPRVGVLHAHLIAIHHRTAAGLDALGSRPAFTNDPGVRRALLQNPLLPAALFRRLWSPRRLLEQYLVAVSHDSPEQVRAMARDLLRMSFNQRAGEERAELILTTEGRCLAGMAGLTLDSHATALLCRRTYISTLFIQNLARWSAAPPALIAHLRRQEVVRRNALLRQLLERHPNAS